MRYIAITLLLLLVNAQAVLAVDSKDNRGLNWQGAEKTQSPILSLGNYRAIIIGNNDYEDKQGIWKQLNTATNDANALAALLKTEYQFSEVKLLLNASRQEILEALNNISETISNDENILVYYAGHGHLEDNELRGYWIPVDAQGNNNSTYIRNSTIRDEINIIATKAKHTLVISDSCFSGALLRSGGRGPSNEEKNSGYYQKVAGKKSVQILAAGGKEFVDDNYQKSGHSPFTFFLLSELKNNPYNLLSFSELATGVTKAVANNVDQTPESGVLQGSGDQLGEFIFAKRTGIPYVETTASSQPKPVNNTATIKTKNMEVKGTALVNHLGSLFIFGVEYYSSPTTSFTGQYSSFSYSYEEDGYTEDGSGTMFGIVRRSYDNRHHLGRYYGVGIDFVSGGWDSYEYNGGSPIYEEGNISGSVPNISTGYKGLFGDLIYEFNGYLGFIIGENASPYIFGLGMSVGTTF